MKIGSWMAGVLIAMLMFHELTYWYHLRIKTVKSKFEIFIILVAVFVITVMAVLLSKNVLQYVIALCVIIFIIADIEKQGITENGILIVAKGKELYRWDEIDHVRIDLSDTMKVDYFATGNSKIATHVYPTNMHDRIMTIFEESHLNVS